MSAARPSAPALGKRDAAERHGREIQRHAAAAFAERLATRPNDFAGTHQRVEQRRRVVVDPPGRTSLSSTDAEWLPLQLLDRIE
jgi:hypothetical protein